MPDDKDDKNQQSTAVYIKTNYDEKIDPVAVINNNYDKDYRETVRKEDES